MNSNVYIIGNGRTLDSVTADLFNPEYTIVTCNEAHLKIDTLNLPNQIIGCHVDDINKKRYTPLSGLVIEPEPNMSDADVEYYRGP
jgi:hypothetical protein